MSALEAIKKFVVDSANGKATSEPDVATLQEGGYIAADLPALIARYRKRQAAAEVLADIPRREKEVQRLEREAQAERNFGNRSISDFPTLTELREALLTLDGQHAGTAQPAKVEARNARFDLTSAKNDALRTLSETADKRIDAEVEPLRKKIQTLRNGIEARRKLQTLESEISRVTDVCNSLVSGRGAEQIRQANGWRPIRELVAEARQKLAALIGMRSEAAAAQKQDADDRKTIAGLERQVEKTSARKIAIENMSWTM